VAPGAAGRSWGVHVARLAGVPAPVVRRAGALLAALEKTREPVIATLPLFAALPAPQQSSPLVEALRDVEPDALSPKEALQVLYRLKEILGDEG